jgi:hypothetical protein
VSGNVFIKAFPVAAITLDKKKSATCKHQISYATEEKWHRNVQSVMCLSGTRSFRRKRGCGKRQTTWRSVKMKTVKIWEMREDVVVWATQGISRAAGRGKRNGATNFRNITHHEKRVRK